MASILTWILPASAAGMLIWTLVIALVIQIFLKLLNRWKEDAALSGVPRPAGHWLLGNALQLGDSLKGLGYLVSWLKRHGSPYCLRIGPFRNALVLSDPECLKTILNTSEPKEPQVRRMLEPWIGDGLLVSTGSKWMRNRRLLTPGFHFQILKPYIGVFSDSTHIMIDKWKGLLKEDGPHLEMFDHISLMVLDNLLKCAFGFNKSIQLEGKKNHYIQAVYDVGELVMRRFQNPLVHADFVYNMTRNGQKFHKATAIIHQYSQGVIQERKNAKGVDDNDDQRKKKYLDFLDILLEAKDKDGNGLTDTEIQHEVDTFMFAGHDTTATALSWFLYNIARHPEHQRKCVEEIESVFGDRDDVTWDDMSDLEYLTMCIKESMRIHTTVPLVGRRITKPMTFPNGITAPAGTWIVSNLYGMHRNPKVWENPEKYDPERFRIENSKDRSPHAFLPFAAGPRNCIGQNFALNELKTCAALLLKHFTFDVQEEPVIWNQLVLRAKNGIWLNVKERK